MEKHLQKTFSMEKLVSHMRNIKIRTSVLIYLCCAFNYKRNCAKNYNTKQNDIDLNNYFITY